MNLKQLADSMNVSETDLMALAISVKNSMVKDGVKQDFLSAGQNKQSEIAKKYVVKANEKMQQFVKTYQTNPAAKYAFQETIYHSFVK